VLGEGEATLLELAQCVSRGGDVTGVNGIAYRNRDGQILLTGKRREIEDLNNLPWPDFDGFGFDALLDHMKPTQAHLLLALLLAYGKHFPYTPYSTSCPWSAASAIRTSSCRCFNLRWEYWPHMA
jgi:hypothetical protein